MKRLLTTILVAAILMLACKKEKKGLASITTTAATNISANSVTTGGNIADDGNSGITKRGIVWATHAAPTVSDSVTNDGSGAGSYTTNLTGLNANTTYFIRAYAVNASGTAYGNEVNFKTNAGVATVTTTAVSNIQPLSAASGGEVVNDGGASITERGLVYATSPNPTTNNFKIVAALGTGIGTYAATLSPLSSQSTYYVRAYAINSYGTSYGNQVQFNAASANTITDIDGNVYPYVTVCGKDWMASNLKTTHYKNGDAITNGSDLSFNWGSGASGYVAAFVYPNLDANKKDSFGLAYSARALADSRGLCPTGWHTPSDDEWKASEICQGMTQAEADATGLRGTIGAKFLEGGSTGLNLQKSGYLIIGEGISLTRYSQFRNYGLFWTSTVDATTTLPFFTLFRGFNVSGPGPIYRTYNNSYAAFIRCVRN